MPLRHLFAQPWALIALAALPLLAGLSAWSAWRSRRALALLTGRGAAERLRGPGRLWDTLRGLGLGFGLLLLIIGSAGPQWDREPEVTTPGRDLVVVLDCSRSMLAERPSRLERARRALADLAGALKRRGGHRVALVVFAARAIVLCPLTHDYDHFREALDSIGDVPDDLDLGPSTSDPSGTRIGTGIDRALELRDPRFAATSDILLLSDGDDPARDRHWEAAAARARARGVPIYAVGLGDPDHDSEVRKEWLRPGEAPFKTRLQEDVLRELAWLTQGEYLPAHTDVLPLGRAYFRLVADQPVREQADDTLLGYRQHYHWFLLPALVLLAASMALPAAGARWRWAAPLDKRGAP
jgi:Ca-activated chloride channel family protein